MKLVVSYVPKVFRLFRCGERFLDHLRYERLLVDMEKCCLTGVRQILEVLLVEWRNTTPRIVVLPERGNKNIKIAIFWSVYSHACVLVD